MAIEVKVHKDVREYKERIVAGMSVRQLGFLSIAVLTNIVISIVFVRFFGYSMDVISWLMILVSMPIVAFGWLKKEGLPFERYLKYFFIYHLDQGVVVYEESDTSQLDEGQLQTEKE
ncbi:MULTISPECIES: PrgI family protein [unclassified Enterococcus]|uniref:PrgI family protein n=1 Tax=unclassified Enterococcus TaxID=2608891 RepID=UPI001A9B4D5B|nr:PrgI family protein [Enterococcus sp. DIV1271a]MBO1301329.1 PrgI family protein [Enterococcus sp. DIV1271a]